MRRSRPVSAQSCLHVQAKLKTSRSCTSQSVGMPANSRSALSPAASGWRSGTRHCELNRGHLCHLPVAALCVRYEGCLQPTLKAAVSWSGGKEVWLGLPLTEETVRRMEASGLD